MIARPALAYPVTVLTRFSPVAVAENTSISRVCGVTLMFSPVTDPVSNVPIDRAPLKDGERFSRVPAIGEKVLFGTVDWYIWALTITDVPTNDSATVVLKNALNDVIVPDSWYLKNVLMRMETYNPRTRSSRIYLPQEYPNEFLKYSNLKQRGLEWQKNYWLFTILLLFPYRKGIDCGGSKYILLAKHRRTKSRTVHSIGSKLGFQAQAAVPLIQDSVFCCCHLLSIRFIIERNLSPSQQAYSRKCVII